MTAVAFMPQLQQPESEPPEPLAKPPGLPPRSVSLGSTRTTATTATTSSGSEPRLSVCSTSGALYERATVVGHTLGSDGVVYYLLEVRAWDAPLDGYVVRRRYNDFKRFHEALGAWMPPETGRARSVSSAPTAPGFVIAGLSSLLLACNPIAAPEMASPLWSPASARGHRRGSSQSERGGSNDAEDAGSVPGDMEQDQDQAGAAVAVAALRPPALYGATCPADTSADLRPGVTYYDPSAALPLGEVKRTLSGRARLPELPSGGLLTSAFLTSGSRARLIADRLTQFNRILAAALTDSSPEVAREVMLFIQNKPGALARTYTSLAEYAAISMPFTVERRARRRAMSMGRQMRDQLSLSELETSPVPREDACRWQNR